MVRLGISPVDTSDLNEFFLKIANVLSNGNLPAEVWAVYYLDTIIAIYLTADEAYASLKLVMQCLDTNSIPAVQTRLDALEIWRKADEAAASNSVPTVHRVKLTP
ncbi:hypothetical protein GCM10009091_49100 [Pseudomonas brenneri]|uniref:Uncharacterized protein n=1 Tax=Pseudomonas brenneri TaxID=129817 RepID=A0A5B2UJV8_9PSED|nr:hypothetical protein [Pseudomonas brenneri]KAA2226752.1 hypothetical protein F1720_25090 [Pseudomonas brenneri]TWR74845.1 hypothetical protein FJD34_25175 [Pseudomonas brenneri]GGL61560.1 hypothetical protein GCM10009091_49100 [Pseudomonas brenneri]SDU90710.1 hypothetical protein SAMN04490181_1349 [Pseudomonas brenneri]